MVSVRETVKSRLNGQRNDFRQRFQLYNEEITHAQEEIYRQRTPLLKYISNIRVKRNQEEASKNDREEL